MRAGNVKILIFGAGYVGLCTGVCFAQKYDVTLVDIDKDKINSIKNNNPKIHEDGLEKFLKLARERESIHPKLISEKFNPVDMIFICVGTPPDTDGYIDFKFVEKVVKTIEERKTEFLKPSGETIIIMKSTVIPGTTNQLLKRLEDKNICEISFNPEFLAQGTAIQNTLNPSRVILGINKKKALKRLKDFYIDFYNNKNIPIVDMSIESAEFSKYAANSFLALKISFANEIADLVEKVENADIDQIMEGISKDPRISSLFLRSGIGFGGSCFPKDVKALIRFSEEISAETPILLSGIIKVNENRPFRLVKLLRNQLKDLNNKKIAILGLAFKPDTNDIREAPSISIIKALWRSGAIINVHDPVIDKIDLEPFKEFNIRIFKDVDECLLGVDACLIITEWDEYKKQSLEELTRGMRNKLVVDGRRIFTDRQVPTEIDYFTIGNPLNRYPPVNPITRELNNKNYDE